MSSHRKYSNFKWAYIASVILVFAVIAALVIADVSGKHNKSSSSIIDVADTSSDAVQSYAETTSDVSSTDDVSSSVSSKTSSVTSKENVPVPEGKYVCYLTFDDGPSTKVTPRILDTLKKYDVKATFFVLGTGKLDILQRYVEEGHAIGLHSNTHEYEIYKSSEAYFSDLQAISDKVCAVTGIRPDILRFPGGSSNKVSIKHCKGIMTKLTEEVQKKGYQYFDWNISSGDAVSGHTATKTEIVNNVLKAATDSKGNPKPSICVLMHDTNSKTATADALPEIIEGLKKLGYSFETLDKSSPAFHHRLNN